MFGRKKESKCDYCKEHIHKMCNKKCSCNCQYYDQYYESMEHFERGDGWEQGGIRVKRLPKDGATE